jgi:alpha-galactosidase
MIVEQSSVFFLETKTTSYVFRPTGFGHLEHVYYGAKIERGPIDSLVYKRTIQTGSAVLYDAARDPAYCLDNVLLEWSGVGCGDYRQTPAEIKLADGTFRNDFTYASYRIIKGCAEMETLPAAYDDGDDAETLEVTLLDKPGGLKLLLYYTTFYETDVITRRAVLINDGAEPVVVRRLMSMQLDLENRGDSLVTFDGAWIKETHRHDRRLQYGQFVNSSTTGASSNRHNPGFLLYENEATESSGNVYGFNLVYSGNHLGLVELSPNDLVRVQLGINPFCFEWPLAPGDRFETPEAILTFSNKGFTA